VNDAAWWRHAIIYEVYPRSFADANGDGIGDLRGLCDRIRYLTNLGVTAIWIAPIFPSPMADFGYDVADYSGVDPVFGSLGDLDAVVAAAHACGIRVILDFVPNHTSECHPWFLASRSSRVDPKRDWYLWRDPKPDGSPPTNWRSQFGGSAWEWDEPTRQYYLHSFLREQPDLNWRNPAVRTAMYDVLRFWLARGIDGFRVDVLWLLIKDDHYRDNPPNPLWKIGESSHEALIPQYTSDRPEVQQIVEEMRAVLDAFGDRVFIGEIYLPVERLVAYYGTGLRGAQLPFNFALLQTPWNAGAIGARMREYQNALPEGAWPNWVLGNHDRPRIASRVGFAQARVAAMLLLTLRGTPTLYYGDELGMTDVAIAPNEVRDPAELRQPGIGMGRDPERTPLPWDPSPNAGFTTGTPWLPLGDHANINVATQDADEASMLTLYRKLIALRQSTPALLDGSLEAVAAYNNVLIYERHLESKSVTIALNLSSESAQLPTPACRIVLSTEPNRATGTHLESNPRIKPNEGLILEA
jgi:alpha-glucosidase